MGCKPAWSIRPGESRVYRHGETITPFVRVRNVGKEVVKFQYLKQFLDETPLVVTDADGKPVAQGGGLMVGGLLHVPVDVTLKPGTEILLESRMHGASGLPFQLAPLEGVKTKTTHPPLVVGTGKFHLQFERVLGNSSSGKIELDPALEKLATGKLELEVKEPEQLPAKKQTYTAWGKEVGGVQAGLGFPPGANRAYRHGEIVTLVVRVRNVGKEGVKFQAFNDWFYTAPPVVVDGNGKPVPLNKVMFWGERQLVDVTLAPGEEIELSEIQVALRAGRENGGDWPWTLSELGKYRLQFEKVGGDIGMREIEYDPVLSKLATGKLELEVQSKPLAAPGEKAADSAKKPTQEQGQTPNADAFTIKNVTIDEVDEKAGVVSVSFGNKEKPTRLANLPLDKGVRVVASHVVR